MPTTKPAPRIMDLVDQAVLPPLDDPEPYLAPDATLERDAHDELTTIALDGELTERELQVARESYALGLARGVRYQGDKTAGQIICNRLAAGIVPGSITTFRRKSA